MKRMLIGVVIGLAIVWAGCGQGPKSAPEPAKAPQVQPQAPVPQAAPEQPAPPAGGQVESKPAEAAQPAQPEQPAAAPETKSATGG